MSLMSLMCRCSTFVLWKGHHRAVGSHGNYNVCCPGVDQIVTCLHCEKPACIVRNHAVAAPCETELTQHCIFRAWSRWIATTVYTSCGIISHPGVDRTRVFDRIPAKIVFFLKPQAMEGGREGEREGQREREK